jgi:hypothetical protein
MPAPRCEDCGKFVRVCYNENYSQVELEVSDDGCATAEYTIEFDCEDCGSTLKTGTLTFEMNDTPEDIAEYIENYVTEDKIEAAREQAKAEYLARIAKEGTELNEDTLKDEMDCSDIALYSHNFSIEECSVEVEEKNVGKAKYYYVTINAHITDDDNPDWEGSDVVLSSDIAYSDLEDY